MLTSYSELKTNLTTNNELVNVIFTDNTTDIKDTYESILNKSFSSLQYEDPNLTMIIILPDSEAGMESLSEKLKDLPKSKIL